MGLRKVKIKMYNNALLWYNTLINLVTNESIVDNESDYIEEVRTVGLL